eukprot:jgi/Chlat1/9151/Chrsp97S08396
MVFCCSTETVSNAHTTSQKHTMEEPLMSSLGGPAGEDNNKDQHDKHKTIREEASDEEEAYPEDDDNDTIDDEAQAAMMAAAHARLSRNSKTRRSGVSAESAHVTSGGGVGLGLSGLGNSDGSGVVEKSEEQREKLAGALRASILLAHVSDKQMTSLVDALYPESVPAGKEIITQGTNGDTFYVLESGECHVFKSSLLVRTYVPSDSFGELALLYNAPRAATVAAASDCELWCLAGATYRAIVTSGAARRRADWERFLADVPLLSSLSPPERSALADALDPISFLPGDVIIREGDVGDRFFILEEGEVEARTAKGQKMKYGRGAYFGELALMHDVPRQATCTALTKVQCVSVDRRSFKRILGKMEEILKRNAEFYHLCVEQGVIAH